MSWRAKDDPPALRSGLLKICAGVVEEATAEPSLSAVEAARQAVAASNDDMTPQQRVSLGHAVELNLINRKRHPVELVCYTHQLPIGKKRFYMARKLFCQTLIEQLGLVDARSLQASPRRRFH